MNTSKLMASIISLLAVAACSKTGQFDPSKALKRINSATISDRAQNYTHTVALIRLKNPSLLASLVLNEEGELEVSEEQKKVVLAEQASLMEELSNISSEIQLLYSYRFSINGIAVVTPMKYYSKISELGTIASIEKEKEFHRLETTASDKSEGFNLTSSDYIGATKANKELGLKGRGIKVGIIDTGIDYTHSMFAGAGTEEAFKAEDQNIASENFPNAKVVGGYDFVGTNYSPGSNFPPYRIPKPDVNPMDEGGHGTHVAGSVAGIGDGVNTYSGVAPEADLYALKVFGANGGTSDTVVIAAMEYAVDPNGDLDISDRLDVINLSLGGNFGKPYVMYDLAVKNLAKVGIVTVAAAGNSGHNPYIVGSPSTASEAISVAASIDGMEHNWKFKSVSFTGERSSEDLLSKVIEGVISKPVAESADIKGKLVYIGDASVDLTEEQVEKLKGHIALIDRGTVSFVDKLKRAFSAGAIGAVVANNKAGEPIQMGGEGKIEIPAVMITMALGDSLKKLMDSGDVTADFGSTQKIESPELIDTLTSFTSRGPRSFDGLIKPEIAAPGFKIISAQMGGGNKGVALNGTSMAAPHMAGVIALMKEKFSLLSVSDIKSLSMNNAKIIKDAKSEVYPVTMQGAGRVQVYETLMAESLVTPGSLSLGETNLISSKTLSKKLVIKNLSNEDKTFKLTSSVKENMEFTLPSEVLVEANSEKEVSIRVKLINPKSDNAIVNIEGRIIIKDGEKIVSQIPVLAVSKKISKIKNDKLSVLAGSLAESEGAIVEASFTNKSSNTGDILLFNSLGRDERKEDQGINNEVLMRTCDLRNVGYRIINSADGAKVLQVGVKLYNPVSRWVGCEVSVQVDTNGDKVAEQELSGSPSSRLQGLGGALVADFYSVLLDATKVRELRRVFELQFVNAPSTNVETKPFTLIPAVQSVRRMKKYDNSTVALVEVEVSKLKVKKNGKLSIKVGTLGDAGVETDDFLNGEKWLTISLNEDDQALKGIPELITVAAKKTETVEMEKGAGKHKLLALYPHNKDQKVGSLLKDDQAQILKPSFTK